MAINQMSKRGSKRLSLGARQRPKKTNVKRLKSTEFIFLALLSFGLISTILSFLYYRSSVAFPFENILQQEATISLPSAEIKKSEEPLSLTTYSYGTTNIEEFKRLNRKYLINRQQQISESESYLSTKAKGQRSNGKSITTLAFGGKYFFQGFRNQIMALTMLAVMANHGGHEQLLLDSLNHNDTFGSNEVELFDFFFDVEHWNRYSYREENVANHSLPAYENPEQFPIHLPRLVYHDPSLHEQWDPVTNGYENKEMIPTATRPYGYGHEHNEQPFWNLFNLNYPYGRGKGPYVAWSIDEEKNSHWHPNPADVLIMQGALRPHPAMQAVIDRSKRYLWEKVVEREETPTATASSLRYMTLHARVEPDMQKHNGCKRLKVIELKRIVDLIERKWPEPPVDVIFIQINRDILESEGKLPENYTRDNESSDNINWVAVENLRLLNSITNHKDAEDGKAAGGLWKGTVPVVEFGVEALRGTVYEHRPSLSGALLDFFLGLDADIFIGTEVSSFSQNMMNTRFYRAVSDPDTAGKTKDLRKENYSYRPRRIAKWINEDTIRPPHFQC